MSLPDKSCDLARRLHRSGWRLEPLADAFGVEADEMQRVLRGERSHGYPSRYKATARRLRASGRLSYDAIAYLLAQQYGREPSPSTVAKWCRGPSEGVTCA